MSTEVDPEPKKIEDVFIDASLSRVYRIDFYQREYEWGRDTVDQLLKDIFDTFNPKYEQNKLEGKEFEKNITKCYGWYYLNTIIISREDSDTYLVDGQQRLTTLLLILIALYHLSNKHIGQYKDKIERLLLVNKGDNNPFPIDHGKSNLTLNEIYKHSKNASEPQIGGITSKTLIDNYRYIYDKLTQEIANNSHKLDTFVFFFIQKIILIKLIINDIEDVPMVFEVINDRGEALKPHEVLKGKLLAKIEKEEVLKENGYNEKWKNITNSLLNRGKDVDLFFEHFFTARYSETQEDRNKYFAKSTYHRGIYQFIQKENINILSNGNKIKKFLDKDLQYYAQLYLDLIQDKEESDSAPAVFYNHLTGMHNNQFLLIMAGVALDDSKCQEKIKIISEELDRFRVLLSMQGVYDSNRLNNEIYIMIPKIREAKKPEDIRTIFNGRLRKSIKDAKDNQSIRCDFQLKYFKDITINEITKYFFARIERFLNPDCKDKMFDWVNNRGKKTGVQIEHILSDNEINKHPPIAAREDVWDQQRQRLGGVLLLRARDNAHLSNDPYPDRWKVYGKSEFFWNKTLLFNITQKKLSDKFDKDELSLINTELDEIKKNVEKHGLQLDKFGAPKGNVHFSVNNIEQRQKMLFRIAEIIWDNR